VNTSTWGKNKLAHKTQCEFVILFIGMEWFIHAFLWLKT